MWGKVRVSQHDGRAFESHFGHYWRGPKVIRLLKVGLAAANWMTSPSPTVGPALGWTGANKKSEGKKFPQKKSLNIYLTFF